LYFFLKKSAITIQIFTSMYCMCIDLCTYKFRLKGIILILFAIKVDEML